MTSKAQMTKKYIDKVYLMKKTFVLQGIASWKGKDSTMRLNMANDRSHQKLVSRLHAE